MDDLKTAVKITASNEDIKLLAKEASHKLIDRLTNADDVPSQRLYFLMKGIELYLIQVDAHIHIVGDVPAPVRILD